MQNKIINIELSEREKEIFESIVNLYISKASPVGSKYLADYLEGKLKLSSATIRNVMKELEEMELINQPHTSAGRIPTDKGYRYYIDSLIEIEDLSEADIRTVHEALLGTPPDVLQDASRILGFLSRYLSLVEIPNLKELKVEKIEIVSLTSRRFLIVIALDSNNVKTVTLESELEIDTGRISDIVSYINEKVSGRPLRFIRENFNEIIEESDLREQPLVRLFMESTEEIFSFRPGSEKILLAGTKNLLDYPEFDDTEQLRNVIGIIEDKDTIINLLKSMEESDENLKVFIGSEMQQKNLEDYSFVISTYRMGQAVGSIGLIGPKRMYYSKVISLLKHVSQELSS